MQSKTGAVSTLIVAMIVLAATVVTLGAPDFGLAGQFLSGDYPSTAAALALVSIICWLLIVAFVVAIVAVAFKGATEHQLLIRRWARGVTFCLAGGIVLAVGVYRHASVSYSMTCDHCQQRISEATQLAGH